MGMPVRQRECVITTIKTLLALAVLVTVAGCVNAPRPPASGQRWTGLDDADTLNVAEQLLLRDCMRHAGFDYVVYDPREIPEVRGFPYVLDDVGWARRHGYGTDLRRAQERAVADDPNERYFQGLPGKRRAAALVAANGSDPNRLTITTIDGAQYGRDPHSCGSQAMQRLYGDLAGWFGARASMDAITAMRTSAVLADPAFVRATRPWADCMRRAGHPFTDPAALRASLPDSAHPMPRAAEISLATAEATCAKRSGLAATAAALDKRHDVALRARYRTVVSTYQRLRAAALPRARSIVGIEHAGA
jgi:hypothetical protein